MLHIFRYLLLSINLCLFLFLFKVRRAYLINNLAASFDIVLDYHSLSVIIAEYPPFFFNPLQQIMILTKPNGLHDSQDMNVPTHSFIVLYF